MSFPERLANLRKTNAVTQKQLAAKTGISEIGIRSYEGRRRQPTADKLISLADFFNVSLEVTIRRGFNFERTKIYLWFPTTRLSAGFG